MISIKDGAVSEGGVGPRRSGVRRAQLTLKVMIGEDEERMTGETGEMQRQRWGVERGPRSEVRSMRMRAKQNAVTAAEDNSHTKARSARRDK